MLKNYTLKICSFVLLCLCLTACAKNQGITVHTQTAKADKLWENFINKKTNTLPYNMSGSLRFGYQNQTDRANFILWSNGDSPLRFDIIAGVGNTMAQIAEDDKTLFVYLVQDEKAILSSNDKGLNAIIPLEIPIPLNFLNISHLLRGNYQSAFGKLELKNIEKNSMDKEAIYHFENKNYFGNVLLNELALPKEININDRWKLSIDYTENNLPRKLNLVSEKDDYKLILIIKNFSNTSPYPKNKLELALPKNIPVVANN